MDTAPEHTASQQKPKALFGSASHMAGAGWKQMEGGLGIILRLSCLSGDVPGGGILVDIGRGSGTTRDRTCVWKAAGFNLSFLI